MWLYKKCMYLGDDGESYEAYEVLKHCFCEDSKRWYTVDQTPHLWLEHGENAHRKIELVERFIQSRNS